MTEQTSQDTAPFGLLGRKLGHSWSPQIHARLGSVPYELHELEPEELGIPSESGLAMLVGQARFSSELFQGHAIEDEVLEKIEDELRSLTRSVVLIGMPGAGKTSCGKRLARMLGRPFVDIDEAILADTGRSAAQIIQEDGEDAFRRVETEVTASYCKRSGMVIACGGGVVTRPQNRDLLRQNYTDLHKLSLSQ